MNLKVLWWLLALFVGAGVIAFLMTPVDGPFPTGKTGTVGEWMAALGAVLAVAGALTIATNEQRHTETRRADDAANMEVLRWRDVAAQRLSDARRVVATVERLVRTTTFPDGTGYQLHATIANYGSGPIRSVRLVLRWADEVHDKVTTSDGSPATHTIHAVMAPNANTGTREIGELKVPPGTDLELSMLRYYGVRFIDIHGDEWIIKFGSDFGNSLDHELTTPQREFWARFPAETQSFLTG